MDWSLVNIGERAEASWYILEVFNWFEWMRVRWMDGWIGVYGFGL